jgi:hypothetical protein
MSHFGAAIIGFEFPSLDFIMYVPCALRYPDTLKEAVEEATAASHPDDFRRVACERFALRWGEEAVDLLNCHLMDCQQALITEALLSCSEDEKAGRRER